MGKATIEQRLQRLEDIEAVKQTMYLYWRALDDRLWDELPECFTKDATADYGMPAWKRRGRKAVIAFLFENESGADYRVSHAGHNAEITIVDGDNARGLFKLHDWVVMNGTTAMRGFGQYDVNFVRRKARWRIRKLKLHYTYREEHTVFIDNKRTQVTAALLDEG
jgi:hypothetical protein